VTSCPSAILGVADGGAPHISAHRLSASCAAQMQPLADHGLSISERAGALPSERSGWRRCTGASPAHSRQRPAHSWSCRCLPGNNIPHYTLMMMLILVAGPWHDLHCRHSLLPSVELSQGLHHHQSSSDTPPDMDAGGRLYLNLSCSRCCVSHQRSCRRRSFGCRWRRWRRPCWRRQTPECSQTSRRSASGCRGQEDMLLRHCSPPVRWRQGKLRKHLIIQAVPPCCPVHCSTSCSRQQHVHRCAGPHKHALPDRIHQGWIQGAACVEVQGVTGSHLLPALWHCELLAW
jgi:hypothetical protein